MILAGIISFAFRGLNFGIDFRGGTSWTVVKPGISATVARDKLNAAGFGSATVEVLGGKTLQIQDRIEGSPNKATQEKAEITNIAAQLAHTSVNNVSISDIGPTWGSYITEKAIEALIVFFVVVSLYITFRFEWKMAVAAIVAVIHDILVTVGIYSLSGFQVTPDTVVAFLTILGYSLYDTMVVFDRVTDNVKTLGQQGKASLSSLVNLSMNEVLARSINTSLVAILPILSVLVLGAQILGATTLQYFGLALLIGLTTGAYSSIFIASPLFAKLKEREPKFREIRKRLEMRGEADRLFSPKEILSSRVIPAGSGVRKGNLLRPNSVSRLSVNEGERELVGVGARFNPEQSDDVVSNDPPLVRRKKKPSRRNRKK